MSFTGFAKQQALSKVALLFTSGDIFDKLRKQVLELEYEDLSGEEKKAKSIEFIKEDLGDVAKVVVNLLLEIACAYVQIQTSKIK